MHLSFLTNIDHSILCYADIFDPIVVSTVSILIIISWVLLVQTAFVYFQLLQAYLGLVLLLNSRHINNLTLTHAKVLSMVL